MTLRERALAILGFRVLPTTVVVGLTYLVIFVATLVYQEIPFAPSAETTRKAGVSFEDAWADLQVIATFPHPFNSRQNEVVQKHILTRLEAIASSHSGVEVEFDNQTAATYVHTYGAAVAGHYEATNILARINGTQPELDSVLISAHYDSVSTAPGATDDGMGVVTAIALVDYFSRNQPTRTLIFNINNGEEDGLWGARIFMEHPWSKLPTTFLNLEGAGAGGRPMLFRASSAAVTKAFRHVARPHGSSLTSDSFALGVVKSGTDFSIYSDAGMEGLDLAFYSRRSLYHTKDDSVPALGGKASLWTMLEASLATVKSLSSNEGTITGGGSPIYVDFLGHFMLVATQTTFFVVNLVLLIVGPIAVLALLFVYSRLGELQRLTKGWVRYPAALLINMVSTFGLAFMIVKLNPNVAYASTYIVLLSLLSVSYLSLYLPLRLAQHWKPVHQPKSTGLLSVYWLSWIFLVVSEVLLNGPGMGGLFFATFLNSMSLLAVLLDFAQSLYVPRSTRVIRSRAIEHQAGEAEAVESEEVTEVTPLLGEGTNGVSAEKETGEDNQPVLWVVQLLALATTNGILMMQAALLVLFALGQTVVDGNSPVPIYFGVAVCAILLFVPIAPFIHKIHHNVAVAVLLLLVISVPYVLLASSFSESAPLKVYFQQTVDLDTGANLVHINSLPGYATRDIIPDLPSARGKNVTCGASEKRAWNLLDCSWSGYEPSVAPGSPDEWLRMSASRLSPGTGRIVIHGANTHACRIYFDRPISSFRLEGDSQALTTSVKLARLWSRSWNPKFDAVVKWTGGGKLTGRAACGWAEQGQAIPALQEIISFLPSWARVTKLDDGLVEVSKSFKI
ncbi:Zn-dependent exopeptidase [Exidia glandulosa HHB12029]|uniref:Peptide hydrolase n=1 Tax=Exidia glandulosa HHB12029 TaxID=1314781 RepID=A0A165CJQ6_EXIGL|nr:Zn-dependent exopeptidase [Exidia glandulosa HHB12029]